VICKKSEEELRIRSFLVLCLLIVVSHANYDPVTAAFSQSFSTVYLSPVSYNATSGSDFTVDVMLNLVADQNIAGFDLKLNYTNPQPSPIVQAVDLNYSGNIFGSTSQNFVSAECVFGISTTVGPCADPTDSIPGWVHFSAAPESGNPVVGPRNGRLFSVKFHVSGTGASLIRISTADVERSGPAPYFTIETIPVITQDAIFSNSRITAFFNYQPSNTPTVVAGHPNSFDASGSFNGADSSISITKYDWNFDDGTTNSTTSPSTTHTFPSPRSYNVKLNVTDTLGNTNSTHRMIKVGPALGALLLSVYSLQKILQSGVLVQIFNASTASPFGNATTDSGGQVVFQNLSPGDYLLAFSGPYVTNSTVTETVIAGWTTQDSVGIKVDVPPLPPPTPWYGDTVFLGSLAGSLGIFGLGLFFRRRNMRKKLHAKRASLRKK